MLSCTKQTVTDIGCSGAACAFKTKLMMLEKVLIQGAFKR